LARERKKGKKREEMIIDDNPTIIHRDAPHHIGEDKMTRANNFSNNIKMPLMTLVITKNKPCESTQIPKQIQT
jgi:hypothetical protein